MIEREKEIKKVQICLRCTKTSYGSLSFNVPKHIAEKMNTNGKFLVTIEEIENFTYSHGRVIIEPLQK